MDDPPILTEDELRSAVRQVFKRAQTDWEFRQLCLADPAAAIREVSGRSLPSGFVLQFRDTREPVG
ncbi:hypothetical protein B1987_23885 [Mycobacterium kansasii]|uniref:Uncharacterized protein n=1 Tax=Mycobacterium attenuatum TaxID=2341086 RepID=A0A498PTS7_9MYCO|nr:hypothetical protein [Mycobacterium attenuatum]ORB86306.1 hypothetical protein B1987_23885 [Mycobacterium kansasii]VBA37128.1 hypothetical protein LAUMK136_01760 [Mycobacterium attenuatum]VBA50001.1 hypothetical protein LAUMK191_01749 [Mycobacterium attenuatum]